MKSYVIHPKLLNIFLNVFDILIVLDVDDVKFKNPKHSHSFQRPLKW